MKGFFLSLMIVLVLCLYTSSCESDNNTAYNTELAQLHLRQKEIEDLVATSVCGDTYECKFIAFGSKPCGGPWSYLFYSTSIDTENLETMVEAFNKRQEAFNRKWNEASDCAFVVPPTDIACENNICIPVYQN